MIKRLQREKLCTGITYNFTFTNGPTDLHMAAYALKTNDRSSSVIAFESKSRVHIEMSCSFIKSFSCRL